MLASVDTTARRLTENPGLVRCAAMKLRVRSAATTSSSARLIQEDTLCWDSMPAATREWMRANRTPLAEHWNVLTRLRAEDVHNAA